MAIVWKEPFVSRLIYRTSEGHFRFALRCAIPQAGRVKFIETPLKGVFLIELEKRGIRYNDPKFGIKWPMEPAVTSDKDQNHPDFKPETHLK